MNYFLIKHIHVTSAVLSIVFFLIRAVWSVTENALLHHKAVKVLPHIVYSVPLVCGVILTAMLGPSQPWILAKIVALVFYIGVGNLAIKRGKTPTSRAVAAIIATLIFFYIVGVALAHNPMSWLS